jgi:cyclopropane fatty-acyl-phospholipid synthase-like methyltransferase
MREDPDYCEQFTRMLLELHTALAAALAARLPLAGVRRLLDLGGGSGVMSQALLRAHTGLEAVVVDIPSVCAVGERLAAEAGLASRLRFAPVADFTVDPLPAGCDFVLECDLSVHTETLFRRLHDALPAGGRLALVDQFAPAPGIAAPERVLWRFEGALLDSEFETPTAAAVLGQLERAGFRLVLEDRLDTVWTLLLVERD